MYRHQQGNGRTFKHNLHLASILSLVAGIVNATGFLNLGIFTTNVTGHFALFIYDLDKLDFWKSLIYFAYIFSFMTGSFFSSILLELSKLKNKKNMFLIPVIVEIILLLFIALLTLSGVLEDTQTIACLLLFTMGHQNSFVTKISNAIVRTTHLTGLFTDLGIELSHILLKKSLQSHILVKERIQIRLYIIIFFLIGGLTGGYFSLQMHWGFNTLFLGACILIMSLFYDQFQMKRLRNTRRRNALHHSLREKPVSS